jgi:hypothetical protein
MRWIGKKLRSLPFRIEAGRANLEGKKAGEDR